jgi:DNA excision repair protein ERCC-4
VADLLYDLREERSGIPAALREAGIDAVGSVLPAGDYVVSERLIVERKSSTDLAASIKDRRLFEQLDRLRAAYAAVVLIVEDEPLHIAEASWKGALARALGAGAAILRTDDPDDTAAWLVRLHRIERKAASPPRALARVRRPTGDDRQTAEDVLRCLPGISAVGARRLLDHFGSLAEVFAADDDALREVRGIGPVRAAALARLFRAR